MDYHLKPFDELVKMNVNFREITIKLFLDIDLKYFFRMMDKIFSEMTEYDRLFGKTRIFIRQETIFYIE